MHTFPRQLLGLVLAAVLSASAVAAQTAMEERFEGDAGRLPKGWHVVAGRWHVDRGALVVESLGAESRILFGQPDWQNYEIEVTATFTKTDDPSRWLSVVFRAAADGSSPWSHFAVRQDTTLRSAAEFAVRLGKDWSVRRKAAAGAKPRPGKPRRLRVVVRGTSVRAYVDGELRIESPFCLERDTGCVGLAASGCVARFDDFVVRRLPKSPPSLKRPLRRCDIVGHRGFSHVAPENTLAAIDLAIDAKADGSEFDVYRCRGGTIVVMHDRTVDRTTNGHGRVTELTLEAIKKLDAGSWKDPKYAGEPVPTLDEALARLKTSSCMAVVEIKMEGISKAVVQAIRKAGMLDQAAVIAFSKNVVSEVRALEPRLPCAWLCSKRLEGTAAEQAAWIAAQAADCKTTMVDLNFQMLSSDVIEELHRRNITVWTWTVDDPAVMAALSRWGVDSITTNRPDLLAEVLRPARKSP